MIFWIYRYSSYCHYWQTMRYHQFHFSVDFQVRTSCPNRHNYGTMCYKCPYINFIPKCPYSMNFHCKCQEPLANLFMRWPFVQPFHQFPVMRMEGLFSNLESYKNDKYQQNVSEHWHRLVFLDTNFKIPMTRTWARFPLIKQY